MRKDLMTLLACPQCKDELALEIGEEDPTTGEVLKGTLLCVTCGRTFYIVDGIPDLRPPADME